jgi:hypothetical protein
LKAAVVTPRAASPAAKSWFTTRMGASAPRRRFQASSMGRWSSTSCSSAESRATLRVSASSRRHTKASKAAFSENQPSS